MIGNAKSLRRQVKNVACNYSDAQVKVREATSNDPWGPSSSLMSEVADMTYNTMAFAEIMQMIWKRLNDHGKNWRHVYKSLVLLDYLIKVGSERVAQQCRENIYAIQTLRDFQHVEENKDQGMNVREKAKQLVNLLKDDERLKNERARALMARKRFAQNGMGIGSDGSTHSFRRSDTYYADDDYDAGASNAEGVSMRHRRRSELEECRPASMGEEELQLQIALALSKEEAQKEEEVRKHDDLRLQLAIQESRQIDKRHSLDSAASPRVASGGARAASQSKGSAIDDLLSLQPAFTGNTHDPFATPRGATASQMDPWGMPIAAQHHSPLSMGPGNVPPPMDPWGGSGLATQPSRISNNDLLADRYSAGGGMSPPSYNAAVAADPWNLDPLSSSLPEDNASATASKRAAATKTPDHFLGENSALVNLDNLMGPAKPGILGVPPRATTSNPFAGGGAGFSGSGSTTVNPFTAQQTRPSSTLNEMRQTNVQQQQPSAGASWQPSSTNPFL